MVHDNTINGIISWFHTRVKVHDLDTLMLPDMNQPLMLFNTSPERRSLMHYNLGLVLKYSGYIQMYYTHFYLTLIHCIRALLSLLSRALITVTHRITPNVTVMRCDSNEEIAINMVVRNDTAGYWKRKTWFFIRNNTPNSAAAALCS